MPFDLRDYQREGVEAIQDAMTRVKRVCYQCPTGGGKCLGKGTPVLMYGGRTKPVMSIKVGDKLIGPDSLPRLVTSTCKGRELLYVVKPTGRLEFTANESHILSLMHIGTGVVVNIAIKDYVKAGEDFKSNHAAWFVPNVHGVGRYVEPKPFLTGITVEPIGVGDYYGFELAGPDRLFLLGDFTVTHNTVLFGHMAERAAARGRRVGILVHRKELMRQASMKLDRPHGIVKAGITPRPYENIQICSIQTLARRAHKYPFDFLIVDECHHATSKMYQTVFEHNPNAWILGVTATPTRLDGKGLDRDFDALVKGPKVRWLMDRGHLSEAEVYRPSHVDLSGLRTQAGDWRKDELTEAFDKRTITGDAVEHYRRHCDGKPAIAFCVSVTHAQHVATEFLYAGYRATHVDGNMDDATRERAIYGLADGTYQVVTSCELISEGVDVPVVEAIIMLRPTQSLAMVLQQIGRGLRPADGKERAVILDHAGNCVHHAVLPDTDIDWTLEGKPNKSKKAKADEVSRVWECRKCYRVNPIYVKVCADCGFERVLKPREIERVDGTLEILTPEQIRDMRRAEMRQARGYEDLVEVGKRLGYKNPTGWAWHVHQHRKNRRRKTAVEG